MLDSLKKIFGGDTDDQKANIVRFEVLVPDFIPYACHYDKDTILTKNGELLQSIKIEGFSYEETSEAELSLREKIRDIILQNVNSLGFSVYFHTTRQATNLDTAPRYGLYFSKKIHDSWVSVNGWNKKYINELHVTIVKSGIRLDFGKLLTSSGEALANMHDEALLKAHEDLNSVVNNVLNGLSQYGVKKLGIVNDPEKGYCSELLKFFGKIIHGEDADFPVDIQDLSKDLAIHKIAFGYNALEIKRNSEKVFATMFSIKENDEIETNILGTFLQLPHRMVVTQVFNFIDSKEGYEPFEHQNYILGVSGDREFKTKSGLDEVESAGRKEGNNFCTVQTTVMVIADNLRRLELDSLEVYGKLCNIGFPCVREDLNMEHCFWSQLPGNFAYIERKSVSLSTKMGSFAFLNNLPFGALKSKWGESITLLNTVLNTPYFFNFHVEDNGHTIIVGDNKEEKIALMNFLLSESTKLNTRFIYLDAYKGSEAYLRTMGVDYKIFSFDSSINELKMNPLLLPDNEANREFLQHWFIFLSDAYTKLDRCKDYLPVIAKAIDVMFSLPAEKRRLSNIGEFFIDSSMDNINKEIIGGIHDWIGEGKLGHIFDNDSDYLTLNKEANLGIDIAAVYDTTMGFNLPVLTYILYFFKQYFTGEVPSILCVIEANRVFNSLYFKKNLEYILDSLTSSNSVSLVTASFCSEKVNWSEKIGRLYNKKMATKIFMADNAPSYSNMIKLFDLTAKDNMYLQSMSADARQAVVKQGNISVLLNIRLSDCEKEFSILSGDPQYNKVVKRLIEEDGKDSEVWLHKLYEHIET